MSDAHDWCELIDRHLRGELSESEKERLAELLDSDAAARKDFVEQVQWDTRLADVLCDSGGSLGAPKDDGNADMLLAQRTAILWKSRTTKFMSVLLAVAALIIVALSATLYFLQPSTERPVEDITAWWASAGQPIAKITGLSGPLGWTGDAGRVAGRFQTVRPADEFPSGHDFEVLLHLRNFRLDPSLDVMRGKLPPAPFGLVVESVWCHTLDKQAGLEIAEVELAPAMDDASKE